MLEIETSDNGRAFSLLADRYQVQEGEQLITMPYGGREQTAAINRQLVNEGLDVYAIHPKQSDLEQLFIDITSENA
jgi:ABC-2 type transport system ATP-binding protein